MCERASVCTPLSVWWASVCVSFLVILRGCRKGRFFSSSLQRLLVSTKRERSSHGPSPRIQQARSFNTKLTGSFINKEKKKEGKSDLNQTGCTLRKNKNNPWQTSEPAAHESERETWERSRDAKNLWEWGASSEVDSLVTEWTWAKKTNNFSSTCIMLSTNINPELMKRSWSKSCWFWDSLKGINPCLVEIKRSLFLSSERSSSN